MSSGRILPQFTVLIIEGEGISASDDIDSEAINPIITLPFLGNRIIAIVTVPAGLESGQYGITVGDCSGQITVR